MAGSANVRSVDGLEELASELARFRQEAGDALASAAYEARRTYEWLQKVRLRWQAEARRRAEQLQQAISALRHCMASGDPESGPPNCSAEERMVAFARRRLEEALLEVRRVEGHLAELEEVTAGYLREAGRLRATLDGDLPAAGALLRRKVGNLRSYLSAGSAGGPLPVASAGSGGMAPAAPGGSADGHADGDVRLVPLSDIDPADWAADSGLVFEKASPEDIAGAIERLESEVRPAVEQGADGDYFSWLDAVRSISPERGSRRVYDLFYGGDAIRLDGAGPPYEVVGGRHRLFIARQLGLRAIVARIAGRRGDGR